MEQARFASAFTFLYSPRPGTPAADREDQIPHQVKLERYNRLIALQEKICLAENQKLEGSTVEVLVAEGEGRKDQETHRISGRARDGRLVHVALPAGQKPPRPGDIVTAKVTYGAPHNLIADSALNGECSRCALLEPEMPGKRAKVKKKHTPSRCLWEFPLFGLVGR